MLNFDEKDEDVNESLEMKGKGVNRTQVCFFFFFWLPGIQGILETIQPLEKKA